MLKRPTYLQKEYPFPSHEMPIGRNTMHYLDEGEGDPILFVHGNPTWSYMYRHEIKKLREDFRCIAPDHIGMGLSTKPQHYAYRLAVHIDNLVHLITELKLTNIHLVVHDWGGPIGLGAAIRLPHRFSSLTITNTACFRLPSAHYLIRLAQLPFIGEILVRSLNLFTFGTLCFFAHDPTVMSDEVRDGYLFPYDNWNNRVAIARFVQDIPLEKTHPSYDTLKFLEEHLTTLKHLPVQYIWGDEDTVFPPSHIELFHKFLAPGPVHRFAEEHHLLHEEAADAIIPLIKEHATKASKAAFSS